MKEFMVVMKEPEKSQQFQTGLMVFEKTAGSERQQIVKTSFVIYQCCSGFRFWRYQTVLGIKQGFF
jgi:hypothetical protein